MSDTVETAPADVPPTAPERDRQPSVQVEVDVGDVYTSAASPEVAVGGSTEMAPMGAAAPSSGEGEMVGDDSLLHSDYTVEFPNTDEKFKMHIENLADLSAARTDPETGEALHILFGVVTAKGPTNEIQLAKLLLDIERAGCHTHSYDAKSGTGLRITRIAVTDTRLLAFAEAIDFSRGLTPGAIKAKCVEVGLHIENPPTAEGKSWFDPYEKLSAPYVGKFDELYDRLTDGERMKLCRLLVTGDSHLKGDAKGCGINIEKLQADEDKAQSTAESSINAQVAAPSVNGAESEGSINAEGPFCQGVFPLHNYAAKKALEDAWLPLDWPWKMPIHDIMEYFGEEIGMYFGFLSHYVTGLTPMVPVAVLAQVFLFLEMFVWETKGMYTSAVFSVVFTCSYSVILDSWKCKQAGLAHEWHAFGAERSLPPRAGFTGHVVRNPTNGALEVDFPPEDRLKRVRFTLAGTASMIFLLLVTTTLIFGWKAALASDASTGFFLLLVPSLLNAAQISVYQVVYKIIADYLTDFENHRTVNEHNAALFRKLTLFFFLSNFTTPLYIAFTKVSVETNGCQDPITGEATDTGSNRACGLELSTNIAVLFITNDFGTRISNSVLMPQVMGWYQEYQAKQDKSTDFSKMGPVEKQHRLLSPYDPTSELVLDYIELYVQWGYLTLFGSACPLVVLFAWVTNFVETRTDGKKLFRDFRRVLPNRVDGIGEPLTIFYYTLYVAVIVNCGLIVYTFNATNMFAESSQTFVLLGVAGFMVAVLQQLDVVYPDVPRKTQIQLGRQDVVHRRVILGEAPDGGDLDFELTEAMLGVSVDKARTDALGVKAASVSHKGGVDKMVITKLTEGTGTAIGASGSNPLMGGGAEP